MNFLYYTTKNCPEDFNIRDQREEIVSVADID